jgi:hypothetical protein
MQESWPDLPPRNTNALWTLTSDVWDKIALFQRYVLSIIESMPRPMRSVAEAKLRDSGHFIIDAQVLKAALSRANILIHSLYL